MKDYNDSNKWWHKKQLRPSQRTAAGVKHVKQFIVQFWTLSVFDPPFGEGLGTYNVYLGFIGKHTVDFLIVIIELFSLDVTARVLRAKIDQKSTISLQWVSLTQNFR